MITFIVFVLSVFISGIACDTLSEVQAISRDGYGRADPNSLLNGFFPAWAIVLLSLSGLFFIITVIAFIGYHCGCKNPRKFTKLQN